jgi:hypothetical protein
VLRQRSPAEALSLANQALKVARRSPKPFERGLLTMHSLSIGSAALQASGQSDQAAGWARQALQAIPISIELRPSEKAEAAALQLRIGNRASAQQLISSLAAIGYRHPLHMAAISAKERT